jgi:hypothetical protein
MSREDSAQRNYTFLARYGATILRGGIASIPSALYRYQGELKLPVQHVWFISAILAHKWDTDLPEPSLKQMARRTGVSEQQLHNYKRKLVDDGWLLIVTQHNARGGQEANAYDFSPLLGKLEELLKRDKPGTNEQARDDAEEGLNPNLVGGLNHTLARGLKPNLVGGLNAPLALKESVDQETLDQEASIYSNDRNSNLFPSNNAHAQLSTTLRRPRTVDKPGAAPPGDGDPEPTAAPTGWSKLAQVAEGLAQRLPDQRRQPGSPPAPSGSGRGRPPKAPPYLAATIEEITHRLNDDPTHVRSNTTRATKLWKYSGLPEDKFVTSVLYQARSLAQQQGNVTKRAAAGAGGPINRVPYFFAVVEDLLGLKDTAGNPA